jgi:hypothetical protein
MIAYGIPQEEIASTVGVAVTTLRKAFAEEIANGAAKANTQVAEFLFATIMGKEIPGKPSITNEQSRMAAMIFWLKTRAHWKETSILQTQELPAEESEARKAINDGLARLAFRRGKKSDTGEPE